MKNMSARFTLAFPTPHKSGNPAEPVVLCRSTMVGICDEDKHK